jgi:hypothetical protein
VKRHLNLMSEHARVRECLRRRLRQWSRVGAAVLALLGVAFLLSWWPTHRESQHRARMEAQYEPILLMKAENKSLQVEIKQLREQETFLLELSDSFPMVNLLGLIGQACGQSQGQAFVKEFSFQREVSANISQNSSQASLLLEGLGLDRNAGTCLADSLQQVLPFASIQLEAASATQVNEQPMHAFSMQCSF